ncbi:hypothetical protein GYMLUDRAFT_835503 [Collybiopsis luxurians FD-317 M1]|uniref:Uncharacterized protein n=1 Tax=Collybiopsis luxurians FD-317 M1 TaxID=944289 RepID=A0A0D0CC95_9AGAR|nr:hypothetical protein GYMLUDRAFT_835503 [Collybiopsis luxurians FD-317 M1]
MDHVGQDQHFDDDEPPRAGNRRAKTGSSSRARTQERALTADDSDEDGFSAVTQTKSRKGVASRGGSASRASSTPPSTRTRATAGTGRSTRASKSSTKSSQPLFVDDSDDNSIVEVHDMSDIEEAPEDGDDDMTLPSTLPAKRKPNIRTVRDAKSTKGSSSKSKKQIPIIVDSDSDEDAFKGFKGR